MNLGELRAGDLRTVTVGLGELKISKDAREVLVAYGLGSCIGLAMYDTVSHVGGLLHALLPERNGHSEVTAAKYVDSGIADLLREVLSAGAMRHRLQLGMVGGANMLTVSDLRRTLNVGERNIAAAQATLTALNLRPRAQQIGGTVGRTMRLYMADGRITVRMAGGEERPL